MEKPFLPAPELTLIITQDFYVSDNEELLLQNRNVPIRFIWITFIYSSIGVSTISLYNKTPVLLTSTHSFSNHLSVEFISEVR